MRTVFFLIGCLLTPLVFLLRWSCRVEFVNDPRPALRAANQPFVYTIYHAHMLWVLIGCRRSDVGTAIVISNSLRSEMLVPILRSHGLVPVRGSGRFLGRDRGDGSVLGELTAMMKNGNVPLLAVDGPRGPRGDVYPGIGALMQRSGAVAIFFTPVMRYRVILHRWDRLQIPLPFVPGKAFWGESLKQETGETTQQLCQRLQVTLANAEEQNDPVEAAAGKIAAGRQRERLAARKARGPA